MSQKPSMSLPLHCASRLINLTAKLGSLLFRSAGALQPESVLMPMAHITTESQVDARRLLPPKVMLMARPCCHRGPCLSPWSSAAGVCVDIYDWVHSPTAAGEWGVVVLCVVTRNLVEAQCDLKVTSSTFLIQVVSDFLKQQNEYSLIVQQTWQPHHLHFADELGRHR